ncbi:type II toxin-antitoxin system HicA family toxin [Candidatus Peregrinibacteria bacterium]|nr:type II toxin-antitoxin system HicA family toxin [Candidatus Peregrinibacteria bacterium]
MSRHEKLIQKFTERPKSLRYHEIESILLYLGFTKDRGKGSHVCFRHPLVKRDVTIPVHNNDCKTIYKKETAKIIKIYFSL